MKKTLKINFRNGVILLILISLFAGCIPLQTSAAEVTGYSHGSIIRLKNVGSGKYLNVGLGIDANGTNVYQYSYDGSTEQKFKLRYIIASDAYVIGTMCSSNGDNRVLDIKRNGNALASGMNVQIYTKSDSIAQYFIFTYYGNGKYAISPKSNTSLFLTSNGNSNGSRSGTSSTSAGNVYVSGKLGQEDGYPTVSDYQLWTLETVQNNLTLNTGYYRIKNKNSGKYMSASANDTLIQKSWYDSTVWKVEHVTYSNRNYHLIFVANRPHIGIVSNLSYSNTSIYPSIYNLSFTLDNECTFYIIKNIDDADTYRIVSHDGYNSTTMTVFTGSTAEGAEICETSYNGANSQRWIFEPVAEGDVTMISRFLDIYTPQIDIGFHEIALQNSQLAHDIATANQLSYNAIPELYSAESFVSHLVGHDITIVNTHGDINCVQINPNLTVSLQQYDNLLTDNESLLGTDLLLWFACYGGYGGTTSNNFAKLSYEKGAEIVLAWKDTINMSEVYYWLDWFYDSVILEQKTIDKFIVEYTDHTDIDSSSSMNSNYLISFGNLNQTIEEVLR